MNNGSQTDLSITWLATAGFFCPIITGFKGVKSKSKELPYKYTTRKESKQTKELKDRLRAIIIGGGNDTAFYVIRDEYSNMSNSYLRFHLKTIRRELNVSNPISKAQVTINRLRAGDSAELINKEDGLTFKYINQLRRNNAI